MAIQASQLSPLFSQGSAFSCDEAALCQQLSATIKPWHALIRRYRLTVRNVLNGHERTLVVTLVVWTADQMAWAVARHARGITNKPAMAAKPIHRQMRN